MICVKIFFIFLNLIFAHKLFDRSDFVTTFPYSNKFKLTSQQTPELTTPPTSTSTSATTQTTPVYYAFGTTSMASLNIEDESDRFQECKDWIETPGPKNTHYGKNGFVEILYTNPYFGTLCTCEKIKECNEKSVSKIDDCKELCKSNLSYFGNSTTNYLTCFNDTFKEIQKTEKCFKDYFIKTGNEFCSKSPTMSYMKNYTGYLESYGIQSENEFKIKHIDSITKKARKIFVEFRKFENCVIKCFKEKTIECYRNFECDLYNPGKSHREKIYETCIPLKNQIHRNAVKSCQCLAFKQNVKELVGSCSRVGNSFLM